MRKSRHFWQKNENEVILHRHLPKDDDGDVGEKFTARESAGDYVRARESS